MKTGGIGLKCATTRKFLLKQLKIHDRLLRLSSEPGCAGHSDPKVWRRHRANLRLLDGFCYSCYAGDHLITRSTLHVQPIIVKVNLVLAWLWLQQLQRWYLKGKKGKGKEEEERAMKVIKDKYAGLGSMNLHEAQVIWTNKKMSPFPFLLQIRCLIS